MGGNQITTKRELSFNDKNNITEMIVRKINQIR